MLLLCPLTVTGVAEPCLSFPSYKMGFIPLPKVIKSQFVVAVTSSVLPKVQPSSCSCVGKQKSRNRIPVFAVAPSHYGREEPGE